MLETVRGIEEFKNCVGWQMWLYGKEDGAGRDSGAGPFSAL